MVEAEPLRLGRVCVGAAVAFVLAGYESAEEEEEEEEEEGEEEEEVVVVVGPEADVDEGGVIICHCGSRRVGLNGMPPRERVGLWRGTGRAKSASLSDKEGEAREDMPCGESRMSPGSSGPRWDAGAASAAGLAVVGWWDRYFWAC